MSCKKNKKPLFDMFEFSFDGYGTSAFSLKFTQSDTIFIKEYFSYYNYDTSKNNKTYFALLSNNQRKTLDSFINKTDFQKFDSSYDEQYTDGIMYRFYFQKDSVQKIINVRSHHVPKELDTLYKWIYFTKGSLPLHQIDSTIIFHHTEGFEPLSIPIELKKFTVPKVVN
ncbi:hypothetical protein A9P82_00915 [Arachidicoccus ginsenosidimutans]|nr:hypothetical protein A9P82_00915 [Arachidicoccus sp. BS20]